MEADLWLSVTRTREQCCLQVRTPSPVVTTSELGLVADCSEEGYSGGRPVFSVIHHSPRCTHPDASSTALDTVIRQHTRPLDCGSISHACLT